MTSLQLLSLSPWSFPQFPVRNSFTTVPFSLMTPSLPAHSYPVLRKERSGKCLVTCRVKFKIGKGVHQRCILSPRLFNLYAEYIMWNARLDEAQAGIKTVGRIINNLRYADDTTLMAESEELKSLLMNVKEESEKLGLKLNIQNTKIMASSPTISWQIDGETTEMVRDFIYLGSKITADGDCSHEIKRRLLLGRKVMTNLDSILKSGDITLPTKIRLVKAMVFPVVMYGWWELNYKESWALKNWCFWLCCWRRRLDSKEIQSVHPKGN